MNTKKILILIAILFIGIVVSNIGSASYTVSTPVTYIVYSTTAGTNQLVPKGEWTFGGDGTANYGLELQYAPGAWTRAWNATTTLNTVYFHSDGVNVRIQNIDNTNARGWAIIGFNSS